VSALVDGLLLGLLVATLGGWLILLANLIRLAVT
jgi:hypothetical protein